MVFDLIWVFCEFVVDVVSIWEEMELYCYVVCNVVVWLGYIDCVVYKFDCDCGEFVQMVVIGEKIFDEDDIEIVNCFIILIGFGIIGSVVIFGWLICVDDLIGDE